MKEKSCVIREEWRQNDRHAEHDLHDGEEDYSVQAGELAEQTHEHLAQEVGGAQYGELE